MYYEVRRNALLAVKAKTRFMKAVLQKPLWIIDEKTFDKVQEEIARRAKLKYRASNSRVFSCFTAKVFCKYCGSTFRRRTVSSKNKANENYKYRWKCGSKIGHKASCFSQYVPEKVLYEKSAEVIGIKDFMLTFHKIIP